MQNNLEERALESAVPGRGNSAAFLTVSAVFAVAAAEGKVAVLASMISAHSPEEKKIHKAAAERLGKAEGNFPQPRATFDESFF